MGRARTGRAGVAARMATFAVIAMRAMTATIALGAGCTIAALPADPVTHHGNGTLIVLNKSDDSATLLDALTGDRLVELPTGPGPHEVAVTPDGTLAAVANYGREPNDTLTLIDLPGARVAGTIDLDGNMRPHGLQFTRDGKRLVVTTEGSGSVLLVDVAARRVLRAVPTGQKISHMLVLSPDGGRAYVANIGSGSVTVLNLTAGRVVATIGTGQGAEGLDLSPDGRELWVANRDADTLTVIDTARLAVAATLPCPGFPIRVKFTPDGARVLVSNAQAGDVAVFDAAERVLETRIPMALTPIESADGRIFASGGFAGSPVPVGLLISRDGTRAWVANTNADIVTVLDLDKLEVASRMKAGREPDGLGFTRVRPRGT